MVQDSRSKQRLDAKSTGDKRRNEVQRSASGSIVTREYKALCAQRSSIDTTEGLWLLDGGASDTMTSRKELLRNYVPMSGEVTAGLQDMLD